MQVPASQALTRARLDDRLLQRFGSRGASVDVAALSSKRELEGILPAWWCLAEHAAEPNVFFEPWQLGPAFEHLDARAGSAELVVCGEGGRLTGLVPMQRGSFPFPWLWSVWRHLHCFDTTPLVRVGHEDSFFNNLFAWLEGQGAVVLRWRGVFSDGPIGGCLLRFLERTGRCHAIVARRERPVLNVATDRSEHRQCLELSRSRRRSIARRRRRLEAIGQLAIGTFVGSAVPDIALPQFIELEARGWKGRAGTAIACRPRERAFLESALSLSVERQSAFGHSLELGGRPIAMTLNYRSGGGLWAFKTAYDEQQRAHAPGVLLEVFGSEAAFADPAVAWCDSCCNGADGLMADLWPDRRSIVDVLIGVTPNAGRHLGIALAAEKMTLAARSAAKRMHRASR